MGTDVNITIVTCPQCGAEHGKIKRVTSGDLVPLVENEVARQVLQAERDDLDRQAKNLGDELAAVKLERDALKAEKESKQPT